jgi:D-3-phosphoglycerate dehydrogenase
MRSAVPQAPPFGWLWARLGESLGKMAGALLGTAPRRLQVDVWGVDESLHHPLTVPVLKGVLTPFLGEAVNYVNACHSLRSRRRRIRSIRSLQAPDAVYRKRRRAPAEG